MQFDPLKDTWPHLFCPIGVQTRGVHVSDI